MNDTAAPSATQRWLVAAVIALLPVLIYAPALNSEFLFWDDPKYVLENPLIRDLSLRGVKDVFTSRHFSDYIPLTILTYAFDHAIWKLRAVGYHLTNLVLHVLNACLVLWLVWKIGRHWWIAAATAALFAVHSVNVESVSWVAERKNVLATAFFLGSTLCYARFEGRRWGAYGASLILCACGLLSKPSVVALPLVLVAYELCLGRKRRVIAVAPFFVMAIISGLGTLLTQKAVNAVIPTAVGGGPAGTVFTMSRVLFLYLRKLALPFDLAALYTPKVQSAPFEPAAYAWAVAALAVAVLPFILYRWSRIAAFWCAWFLLALAPVSQVIPFSAVMADRYLYIPMIGAFAVVMMGVVAGVRRRRAATVLVVAAVALLGAQAYARTAVWRTSRALWTDTAARTPGHVTGHNNLAVVYVLDKAYNKAIGQVERSLAIEPDRVDAMIYRGLAHLRLKEFSDAEKWLRGGLEREPRHVKGLSLLGSLRAEQGREDEAAALFRSALDIEPGFPYALEQLAILQRSMGIRRHNGTNGGGS